VADRRRGDAKLVRGRLETHVPRGRLEGAELDEGRQFIHRLIVGEWFSSSTEFFAFASGTAGVGEAIKHNERNGVT
jgi:hypothetical protein